MILNKEESNLKCLLMIFNNSRKIVRWLLYRKKLRKTMLMILNKLKDLLINLKMLRIEVRKDGWWLFIIPLRHKYGEHREVLLRLFLMGSLEHILIIIWLGILRLVLMLIGYCMRKLWLPRIQPNQTIKGWVLILVVESKKKKEKALVAR